ncbi:MAG: hypothetical protein MUF31_09530 [Akkermansiaceae bacterium]|nr:hypothetical protein [Akkermansiaceae bacterium]
MKPLFYILSILAIGGAAYFSNVNKTNFTEQQESRVATIQKRVNVDANIAKTEVQLKSEQEKLETANKELAEVEATISKLKSDQQTLKREMGEVEGELETQQADLAAAEEALQEIADTLKQLGIDGPVTMDTIQSSIKSLEDEKKELDAAVAELDTNIEGAQKNVARNQEEIARLARRKAERDERIRNNAREAVITAVDQNWGFVVIGAGSNSGFKPEASLLVKRDGRVIGQVKPASIEPTQTIANINLEALAPGVVIQPGDRVILANPATN